MTAPSAYDETDQPTEAELAAARRLRFRNRVMGIGLVVATVVALYGVYHKEQIITTLGFGDTVTAVFDRPYKLSPYRDDVKLAGVRVGTVTDEEYDEDTKTSIVSMKVDNGVLDTLGRAPSAHIRPTLVLGGNYYVDLVPGGGTGAFDGEQIPLARTSIPVELDRVLSSLNKPAREGAQGTIAKFDETLRAGGREALRTLVQDSPGTLRPAGGVFDALLGTQPDKDLTAVVDGFDNAAAAVSRTAGQVERIVSSLDRTAGALSESGPELAAAARISPDMLRATRAGLIDLQPTLAKLTETAPDFQDSAKALGPLFDELNPVLADTREMVADLRLLLGDLRPATEDLVPATDRLTRAFDDLSGPVLDRVNGPILDSTKSEYHGVKPFENGGNNGNTLYEEIGFLLSHLNNTFSLWDRNGAIARLTAGVPAGNTLGGSAFPPSSEQLAEMFGLQQPPGPQGAKPGKLPDPPAPNPLLPPGDNDPSIPPAGKRPAVPESSSGARELPLPGVLGDSGGS